MKVLTLQQDSTEVTIKELFEEFIRFKNLQNLSDETIKYYDDCYRYFVEFYGEGICCNISEDTFYNYIEHIHKTKPNLSPATVRSYLTGIRAIFYYGIKKGYIKSFQVQLPKMDEIIKQTYTDHEIMLLLKKPDMKKSEFPE